MRLIKISLSVIILTAVIALSFNSKNGSDELTINRNDENIKMAHDILFYKDKPVNGTVEEFLPGGKIKSRTNYKNGMKGGKEILFFPDGKIYSECEFEKNKMNGKFTGYYIDGKTKFSYSYSDGLLNGESHDYFELGQPGTEKAYSDGTETGPQKEWSRNGRLLKNYNVKEGRRYGLYNESAVCDPVKKGGVWQ